MGSAAHDEIFPPSGFSSIEDAIAALGRGEFVLVLDDEDRENEGDLIIAADKVTPKKIAYMVEYTSGASLFSHPWCGSSGHAWPARNVALAAYPVLSSR